MRLSDMEEEKDTLELFEKGETERTKEDTGKERKNFLGLDKDKVEKYTTQ